MSERIKINDFPIDFRSFLFFYSQNKQAKKEVSLSPSPQKNKQNYRNTKKFIAAICLCCKSQSSVSFLRITLISLINCAIFFANEMATFVLKCHPTFLSRNDFLCSNLLLQFAHVLRDNLPYSLYEFH